MVMINMWYIEDLLGDRSLGNSDSPSDKDDVDPAGR